MLFAPYTLLSAIAIAGAFSAGLIVALMPLMARLAIAVPDERSAHAVPTPQGGGVGVVTATLVVAWGALALDPEAMRAHAGMLTAISASAVLLAVVGAFDDAMHLGVIPRLAAQLAAVALIAAVLPTDLRLLPPVPLVIERALLVLAGLWFVNLVNFMDGMDWMTVVETVPIAAAVLALGLAGETTPVAVPLAAALLGGIVGFAPFNRPVARLFLGDVGSLPIGLLLGCLLILVGARGHLAAALLLPLYYLADSTLTLVRRLSAGEAVWRPHRDHFYQRARARGYTTWDVLGRVGGVNLALAALAMASVLAPGWAPIALAAGAALVGWLLHDLARGRT